LEDEGILDVCEDIAKTRIKMKIEKIEPEIYERIKTPDEDND